MKIKLLINNKRIPMKPFVINVLFNIITGFVKTLERPEEEIESIEIKIER